MNKRTVQINFIAPPDTMEELEELAAKDDRKFSYFVGNILKKEIYENENFIDDSSRRDMLLKYKPIVDKYWPKRTGIDPCKHTISIPNSVKEKMTEDKEYLKELIPGLYAKNTIVLIAVYKFLKESGETEEE